MESKTEIIAKLKKYIHTVYIVLQYILVGKHIKKNVRHSFCYWVQQHACNVPIVTCMHIMPEESKYNKLINYKTNF